MRLVLHSYDEETYDRTCKILYCKQYSYQLNFSADLNYQKRKDWDQEIVCQCIDKLGRVYNFQLSVHDLISIDETVGEYEQLDFGGGFGAEFSDDGYLDLSGEDIKFFFKFILYLFSKYCRLII